MVCPVGLTAPTACAAMRAGIERKRELPYQTDDGLPIVGSYVPTIGELDVMGRDRWIRLLALALLDLRRDRGDAIPGRRPLVLVLPRTASNDRDWVIARLSEALQTRLDSRSISFVHRGSSGGYHALALARSTLTRGEATEVVVGAADSLVNARSLLALDRERRLLTETNSDGVIPGEAGAALIVALQPRGGLGIVRGIGFGEEPGRLDNDVPLRGRGIVAAARAALEEAGLAMHDMDVRLSDASGEAYAFREQVICISRLLRRNKTSFPLWLAALTLGDTGAAAGLCNLIYALHAIRRRAFPGRRAIAYASSDDGDRAALVLDQPSR